MERVHFRYYMIETINLPLFSPHLFPFFSHFLRFSFFPGDKTRSFMTGVESSRTAATWREGSARSSPWWGKDREILPLLHVYFPPLPRVKNVYTLSARFTKRHKEVLITLADCVLGLRARTPSRVNDGGHYVFITSFRRVTARDSATARAEGTAASARERQVPPRTHWAALYMNAYIRICTHI